MAVTIDDALTAQAAAGLVEPLTHARIGWRSIVAGALLTASSEAADFPASALQNPLTWDRWKPTALPATLEIEPGTDDGGPLDYAGIAAHALADGGCTVELRHSDDGAAWTTIASHTPADNAPILFLFAEIDAPFWQLRVTGGTPQPIGVVNLGRVLAMPRPIYGGHSPLDLARSTTIRPHRSERGQFLGRSVVRGGFATSYAWTNLEPDWYRESFDPFVAAALTAPFFIAWRPSAYPAGVGYVWTGDDIKPSNTGTRGLMQVGFSVEGVGNE